MVPDDHELPRQRRCWNCQVLLNLETPSRIVHLSNRLPTRVTLCDSRAGLFASAFGLRLKRGLALALLLPVPLIALGLLNAGKLPLTLAGVGLVVMILAGVALTVNFCWGAVTH
jgi:hypothetical protein